MRPSRSAAAPPSSLTSPKPGATKRQRKAAAATSATAPLGDATNLLVLAETPTPSKLRRTARRSLPALSDASRVSSTCSSSASVTPAPKPSPAAWVTPAPKPSAAAAVTPAPKPSSAASVTPARKPSSASCVTPAPKSSAAAAAVTRARKTSSATCVTPALKPSSAAVIQEERSVLKSPTISTVHRRTTEARVRTRRNPTAANSKGKEPVAATASCTPLGKSARTNDRKKEKDTRPISASAPCHEGKKKRSIASTPNLLEDLLEKQRAYFADIDAFELVEEEVSESELE